MPGTDQFRKSSQILHINSASLNLSHSYLRPGLCSPQLRILSHLSLKHEIWLTTFLGTFTSIIIVTALALALASGGYGADVGGVPLVIGSMGATAVLLYAIPESPLSSPRNAIGGQMISAIIGIVVSCLVLTITAHLLKWQSERLTSSGE